MESIRFSPKPHNDKLRRTAGHPPTAQNILMLRLAFASAALVHGVSSTFEPNFQAAASGLQARLRSDLLGNSSHDLLVQPTGRDVDYSGTGTDVGMQIRFFKVMNVKAAEGSMKLKVWVRMYWKDARLAWNPEDYGGITSTQFKGADPGNFATAEIWTPDIQPYNGEQGTVRTLEPSLVRGSSTGDLFWSRPGSLDVMCKFSGCACWNAPPHELPHNPAAESPSNPD